MNALSAEIQFWRQALAARDFRGAAGLPSDSAVILVSAREARALPPGRMLWSPLPPRLAQSPDGTFRETERLEFGGAHTEEARRAYQSLAQSPDAAMRAGALVRLARIYRGAARWDESLAVYSRLAAFDRVAVVGMPADLLARRERCNVLRSLGRHAAESEISSLQRDWLAGRWLLDRPSFLLMNDQLSAWTGAYKGPPLAGETISEAAEWLLKRMGNTEDAPSGSRFLTWTERRSRLSGKTRFPDGSIMSWSWQISGQTVQFRRLDSRTGKEQTTWTIPSVASLSRPSVGYSRDLMTMFFAQKDEVVPCEGRICTYIVLATDLQTGSDRQICRA